MVLQLLKDELKLAMALSGELAYCTTYISHVENHIHCTLYRMPFHLKYFFGFVVKGSPFSFKIVNFSNL